MEVRGLIIFAAIFSSFVASTYGEGLFSQLPNTISVTVTASQADLKAGEDSITVTWGLNRSLSRVDTSSYRNVEVELCYTPESQKDRPWRKTEDELSRDKTCQHTITKREYNSSTDSVTYTIQKDIPTARYFVRVYVRDGPGGTEVAYGENRAVELNVSGISGRSASIDIAASVFSAFSVVSLAFFFYREKKKAKIEEAKH